ncbi:GNAT family N-acetyltransferase [Peribacillus alkalitolerans]|uniref:GNAT family N-acetyltransferase n=1 Tax=Peribacillus alkalitolerans TaxID=1550385 RepID=UPI0013D62350|nr:GNAT family N-acetyltransferase [Peribacillus alkalitolerans]
MEIRDAILDDLPAILEIYNDAVLNLTATFDLEEQTLEERTLWFHKYGGKYPLIVAKQEGEVVGYCSLSSFRDKPAYNRTAELSIYLSSKHRGLGLGKVLMEELIDRAKKLDYHTLIGGITSGNEASVKLHEKFGFELVGVFKEVGYKFNQWQDVHFYQLILEG